jgi:DNA-binding MltR family transcriptional regulator
MARKIISPEQLSADSKVLYEAINKEPPLGCVLIAAAFLEKALTSLLGKLFVECETAKNVLSENGFLGEFSRCADTAYCLGLISKGMLENLKRIGKIRNLFAHSHQFLDFDTEEVKELCESLTFVTFNQSVGEVDDWFEQALKNPRNQFTVISGLMFSTLNIAALSTDHRQRHSDSWG